MEPDTPSARYISPAAGDSATSGVSAQKAVFKEGRDWIVGYGGNAVRVKDAKGLGYIAHLLRHPTIEFHVLDLIEGIASQREDDESIRWTHGLPQTAEDLEKAGIRIAGLGDAGEMLDKAAKAAYRRRLSELRGELEEAKRFGKVERAERLENEIDALTRELSRAVGLGGRDRQAASASERARQTVTKSIKSVLETIAQRDPTLGDLLSRCIKTGSFCSYQPDPDLPIAWEFAEPITEPAEQPPSSSDPSSTLTWLNPTFGADAEAQLMVGREEELARIRELFAKASAGIRQVVFITGEPGIGKTTFARSFLGAIVPDRVERIGHGQCVEQYGSGEPYMPVLEALTRLCRGPHRALLLGVMRRVAPSWLAQMPSLLSESEHKGLQTVTQGMTQQRMLREMAEALEMMATETPLVLLLEDLHWSDPWTLDLIATVARRSEPACLMVLGTYRPVEILAGEHPLRAVKEELELHQQCIELRLPLLSQADVATYLARRFPDGKEYLSAPGIYARSEGNPLLLVNLVYYLVEQGSLADADKIEAPRNIRQMIERNLQRLSDDEQRVLEAASVAGVEFSVAPIAAALDRPLSEIDARCTRMARGQQFLDGVGVVNWPDGTVAPSFRFHHALYQEVLYSRLPVSYRIELHRRIAVWAEQAYLEQTSEIANELAHHYVSSHQQEKAVECLYHAAQRAISRSAFLEALALARAALALIPELPHNPRRDHREFELLAMLISAATAAEGWGSPETIAGGERMLALARLSGDEAELAAALRGKWASHLSRGRYEETLELAEQMLALAERSKRQAAIADAKTALGWVSLWMGRVRDAVRLFDGALTKCPGGAGRSTLIGMEPVAETFAFSAEGWWVAGYPDRAMYCAQSAVQRARDLRQPLSLATTLFPASWVATWCGQYEAARRLATEGAGIARHEGYPHVSAGCTFVLGWATGLEGRFEEGTDLIHRGIAGWTLAMCVFQHIMLAEVSLKAGQPRDALAALAKFDELARANGEHCGESEAPRLRAEALMMIHRSNATVAEQHLRDAVAISGQQGAKSMELRATVSLARLLDRTGRRDEARAMLAEIYGWFTEGFDTVDLKEAKALLEELRV